MKKSTNLFDLDVLLLLVLGIFAGAFLFDTRSYNATAALFPRLISIVTLVLIVWSIALRVATVLGKHKREQEPEQAQSAGGEGALAWYWSVATMVGYFVLIYLAGFTVATLVYLLAMPLLLGYRKYLNIVLTGGIFTLAFVAVFTYVLHARIPAGILGEFLRQLMAQP
ncbi:MAG: tripartite tricarboxylate transporter TctB family protein [Rhodocyclaceae bacterium]|nr:tripartite tricarboxylate transporter TctB family protein [Rhodocyclaceae bacterium]